MDGPYIAIDWGTSHRRIYRIGQDGAVQAQAGDEVGASTLGKNDYLRSIAAIRADFGPWPVLAAGMVGSRLGWVETPYVPAPASAGDLARAVVRVEPENVILLPGVVRPGRDRADVMRGEEVHALGAAASGALAPDTLLCQPGTHNKWIGMTEGKIADFATVMTGELFSLLRGGGTLAPFLHAPVQDDEAFRAGVLAAGRTPNIAAALFHVRAACLLGDMPNDAGASQVSGLLIGADLLFGRTLGAGTMTIVASGPLGDLYLSAAGHLGLPAQRIDSAASFARGIHDIAALLAP